jgi:ABC-2 type transport system ATP-binding protein
MGNALRVNGLSKRYPGFTLSDVSFGLERGTVMGFIGRNGAGKTTTIKLIMGLICKDAGSVEILGREMGKDGSETREKIGFVYDEHGFYGGMTVRTIGRMTAPFYRNWNPEEFARLVKEFGLDPSRKAGELSRGQRTKLALALALSHGAELLVMDEPTSGLDPVFRSELIDILYRIIQDERKSIFFSTHNTTDLERIADHITFIEDGKIIFSDSKDALLERYRIVKGPRERLSSRGREMCVGVRETRSGFEALSSSAEDLAALVGEDVVVDKANLEDIMVYTVKGVGDGN